MAESEQLCLISSIGRTLGVVSKRGARMTLVSSVVAISAFELVSSAGVTISLVSKIELEEVMA